MIDIADLKDNLDQYKKKLKSKGYLGNLDEILSKNEAKNNKSIPISKNPKPAYAFKTPGVTIK